MSWGMWIFAGLVLSAYQTTTVITKSNVSAAQCAARPIRVDVDVPGVRDSGEYRRVLLAKGFTGKTVRGRVRTREVAQHFVGRLFDYFRNRKDLAAVFGTVHLDVDLVAGAFGSV